MERHFWLWFNYDDDGIRKPLLASLLIHIFIGVIMATTGVFYPETGEIPRLNIVWFYPSLTTERYADPSVSAEPPGHSAEKSPVHFAIARRKEAEQTSGDTDRPGKAQSGSRVNSPSPAIPKTAATELITDPAYKKMKAKLPAAAKPSKNENHREQTPDRPGRAQGIIASMVAGDLKLEISAPPKVLRGIRIFVLFHEYPKAMHNQPMSNSDSRQVQTLAPKIVKPLEKLLVAVIETARDGIYDFVYTSETSDAFEAAFIVNVHENGTDDKTKVVEKRPSGAKGSIVKVLMPEGILWDDESSFSGSMEDSDSITKFDTDSGLTWKEYRE